MPSGPAPPPVLTAILRLAPWAVLSFILQNAYNQNDAWFLSKVSATASNALGLFMMVQIANFGAILVLARGTQSLVARRIGAGNREGAARAYVQGLLLAGRIVLPLAALQWIFAPEILHFMGGRGETVEAATTFLRTLYWFMPVLFLQPITDFTFQALGDTGTPFRLQLLALSINTALNWLLVLPHEWTVGGTVLAFGDLGVAGAATATGVSRLFAGGLGLLLLVRRFGFTPVTQRASWRANGPVLREILRVGLPAGTSTFLYALVGVFVLQVVGRFGQEAYGAYGIGFRGVESVSFMIVLGFGTATATVAGHAMGAGDLARARRAGHVGTWTAVAVMMVSLIVFRVFPGGLAGLFTSDPGLIHVAAGYIAIMALCQPFQALEMVYGDAMAGAGSALRTVLISIPGNLLRVPLAWYLAVGLDLGLEGVWYAVVVSAILKGLGVMALFCSRYWEKTALAARDVVAAR